MDKELKHIIETAQEIADLAMDKEMGKNIDDALGLSNLVATNPSSVELLDNLANEEYMTAALNNFKKRNKTERSEQLFNILQAKKRQRIIRRAIIATSSAVASIITISLLFITPQTTTKKTDTTTQISAENSNQRHVLPILIFSDGSQVELDDNHSEIRTTGGEVINQDGKTLKHNKQHLVNGGNVEYNTLIIPSKLTYKVILCDGTEVTLNADSKLTYPSKFGDHAREVKLQGEAFFKVAKSANSFVVKTENGNVTVYGTEFNIYSVDNIFETILVEGSVGIVIKERDEITITPNTLIGYDNLTGEITKKEVDISKYIGWTNGMFIYDEQTVERVLSDISKWFNISFSYDKELGNKTVSMNMRKEVEIKELINFLEIILNRKLILEERGNYKIVK